MLVNRWKLCLGIGMATATLSAATPDFKEGLWEIRTATQMKGMPMAQTPMEYTNQECLNKDNMIPSQSQQTHQNCSVADRTITDSTAKWNIECDTAKGLGTIHYSHTSFVGTANLQVSTPIGAVEVHSDMYGKYLGPCR